MSSSGQNEKTSFERSCLHIFAASRSPRTRCRPKPIRSASSNGPCGAGESGTVGALPAIMNAVNNALARAVYVLVGASALWQLFRCSRPLAVMMKSRHCAGIQLTECRKFPLSCLTAAGEALSKTTKERPFGT